MRSGAARLNRKEHILSSTSQIVRRLPRLPIPATKGLLTSIDHLIRHHNLTIRLKFLVFRTVRHSELTLFAQCLSYGIVPARGSGVCFLRYVIRNFSIDSATLLSYRYPTLKKCGWRPRDAAMLRTPT